MDKTIKLATYNIVHCLDFSTFKKGDKPGELSVNIEGLAKAVKTLDADIIGLNEVYNTTVFERSPEHGCQAQKIASIAGYPFSVFGRGYLFTHNGQDIGNALMYGSVNSASVVSKFGATDGLLTFKEIESKLNSNPEFTYLIG